MRALLLILIFFSYITLPVLAEADAGSEGKLIKIVALSRHGVRAPTQGHKVLSAWSQKPWPIWPAKKGDLTQRGAKLVTAMWENFRLLLISKGLLPDQACPPANAIYIRADTDERTRATAFAMTQGLGKNCSLGYAVMKDARDPLFHPVKAGLYRFNPAQTAVDILARTKGGLGAMQERYIQPMELLEQIIGSPSPEICIRFSFSPDCKLSDLPNGVSVSHTGDDVKLSGALSIASSIAEIFLLEYGEWPDENAGWGMVNAQVLSQLLPVHSAVFDVVNRAPLVAWARGGFLLNEMAKALEGKHTDPKVNEARLVVFVGHDTNIANLGALLGLNWKLDRYPANGIPPASVLFLELWEKNGKKEVVINFYAQPMDALHSVLGDDVKDLTKFAPVEASLSAGTEKTIYGLEEFVSHVENVAKDAPSIPQAAPEWFYSSPRLQ